MHGGEHHKIEQHCRPIDECADYAASTAFPARRAGGGLAAASQIGGGERAGGTGAAPTLKSDADRMLWRLRGTARFSMAIIAS